MKKIIVIMLVTVLIMGLSSCSGISFKHIENDVMPETFEVSVDSIYCNDDGVDSVFIPSFGEEKSHLKTLSLQNLYDLKKINSIDRNKGYNIYRCSIEESLYLQENRVRVDMLTDEATEEEFFEAYYVTFFIEDENLLKEINQRYSTYKKGTYKSLSEDIYHYINNFIYQDESIRPNERITERASMFIDEYLKEDYLDITYDTLSDMLSCITYLWLTENHSKDDLLSDIYAHYSQDHNEKAILFETDVSTEYYCRIIKVLRRMLAKEDKEDFFYRTAITGNDIYSGLSYDIMTPKNFATYILALSYSDVKISRAHYSVLKGLYQQIVCEVDFDDFFSIYYMNIAKDIIGINDNISIEISKKEKSLPYLYATNQRKDFADLYSKTEDIVEILMICDRSNLSKECKDVLEEINIFDYVSEPGFAEILNLYVCAMLQQDIFTEQLKNDIKEYIESAECDFGFAAYTGAYDFRTSVYYVNILSVLEGGKDIGFR